MFTYYCHLRVASYASSDCVNSWKAKRYPTEAAVGRSGQTLPLCCGKSTGDSLKVHRHPAKSVRVKPEEWLLAWSISRVSGAPGPHLAPSRPLQQRHWSKALRLAEWHRMLPMVHSASQHATAVPPPPESVARTVEQAYRLNVGQGLLRRWELKNLLDAFRDRKLPAMVLKGVAVEDDLYSDPSLRPVGDIDLLVRRSQLSEAEGALASLGFLPSGDLERRKAFRQHHHHLIPYFHPRTHSVVELHWQLLNPRGPYRLNVDLFWERARNATLAGTPYIALSAEDQLLHLCLGFFSDRMWSRNGALFQLCDIALALNKQAQTLDWDQLCDRAIESRSAPSVYASLLACSAATGSVLPESVVTRLRPEELDEAKAMLFVTKRVIGTGREVSVGTVEALALPRTGAKVRGMLQALRPSAKWTPGRVSRQAYRGRSAKSFLLHTVRVLASAARPLMHLRYLWQQVAVEGWLAQVSGQSKSARLGVSYS